MGGVMSEYGDLSQHATQHWARAMWDAADMLTTNDRLGIYCRISGALQDERPASQELQLRASTLVPQRRYSELW